MITKQTNNNFSKIPNILFYFPEKNQDPNPKKRVFSILENTKIENKFNYKALFILDYLYMNTNRRNIITFNLKDIIEDSGFKYNTRKGESVDQFKQILSKLQELKIISTDINFMDMKLSDRVTCTLDIDFSDQFAMLYDSVKDKILNQTIDSSADNKNLLVYYCYLNCRIYKRPKGDELVKSGGRSEVCWVTFETMTKELGFVDITIDKYNDILVALDLIRIGNAGLWYYKDDVNKSLKESCNIYALYTDDEETKHNLDEGIKYWKKLENNLNRVFKGNREYEKNNKVLNGELGSIVKKEKLGTATADDIVRKGEILASTRPDEEKYKIMSILDANPNELLSNIFEGKNIDISDKYYDLEDSLGLVSKNSNEDGDYQLVDGIEYENYKWVMINYKENEHQKFVDYVASKKPSKIKGKGLQNKKPVVVDEVAVTVEDAPDIFEDSFDSDSEVYCDDRTAAEREEDDAWSRKNEEQIPEEVRRYMEEQAEREYTARMDYEDEYRDHLEENY